MNLFYVSFAFFVGILVKMSSYNFRSPLARAIHDKIQHHNEHKDNDHKEWYNVNLKYIAPDIAQKFIQLHQDEETNEFLTNCFNKSEWLFTQIYHGVAKSLLTWFISATSANGLLERGSMFVLSSKQIQQLTGWSFDSDCNENKPTFKPKTLMDLGAGDGEVTKKFQPFVKELYGTETSSIMRWRLASKNIQIIPVPKWTVDGPVKYDVISCLNLLDRCSHPKTMLRDIHEKLHPQNGLLILAIVFPLKQYVEDSHDHKPVEVLKKADTKIWEVQFNYLLQEEILPQGYELISWSRVPYLCEGDFSRAFYVLNDAVLVLKPISIPSNKRNETLVNS